MVQTEAGTGAESTRSSRVYLIGMPGVGKSSVAQEFGALLGWAWFDTDACVVCGSCMTIPEIFAKYGEEEFRKRESDCLYQASMMVNAVIATGGGAPVYRDGMEKMRTTGIVVYLEASIQSLVDRLSRSGIVRPLLHRGSASFEQTLGETLANRENIYKRADCIVNTDGKSVAEIARELFELRITNKDTMHLPGL